ncbi:hypothetical protein L083_0733 [Actinoplanes sp. N902-109]|nr:hypothetical protein L083_0733 [Actinoplanes sp. N902-109]
MPRFRAWRRLRPWLLLIGVSAGVMVVVWSPLIMYKLLGEALPWKDLADVGEAYGGASAILSAAALSGIGFSLVLQARQARQELLSFDKQRHFDLIKLALDNPEFFEVLDTGHVQTAQDRQKVYANLVMNYWFVMWELGEIDEAELRSLAGNMFESAVSRKWWQLQEAAWITVGTHRRRRFMTVVTDERLAAERRAVHRSETDEQRPPPGRPARRPKKAWASALSIALIGAALAGHLHRDRMAKRDPASRP